MQRGGGRLTHFTSTESPGFHVFPNRRFFQDAFGISQAAKPRNERLLFSDRVAASIKKRVWHPSQRLRERRDGRVELRLRSSGRKALTRWVLSWMPEVRVLALAERKAGVVARLQEGRAGQAK